MKRLVVGLVCLVLLVSSPVWGGSGISLQDRFDMIDQGERLYCEIQGGLRSRQDLDIKEKAVVRYYENTYKIVRDETNASE